MVVDRPRPRHLGRAQSGFGRFGADYSGDRMYALPSNVRFHPNGKIHRFSHRRHPYVAEIAGAALQRRDLLAHRHWKFPEPPFWRRLMAVPREDNVSVIAYLRFGVLSDA